MANLKGNKESNPDAPGGPPLKGLQANFHGPIYQVRLSMLFAWRSYKHGYKFKLTSETEDRAGSFDDIVLQKIIYSGVETSASKKRKVSIPLFNFVQAKHVIKKEIASIRRAELVNTSSALNILTCFETFRNVTCKEFKQSEIEYVILCTNLVLDGSLRNLFNEVPLDNIFGCGAAFSMQEPKMYAFKSCDDFKALIDEAIEKQNQVDSKAHSKGKKLKKSISPPTQLDIERFVDKFRLVANAKTKWICEVLKIELNAHVRFKGFMNASFQIEMQKLLDASDKVLEIDEHKMHKFLKKARAQLNCISLVGMTQIKLHEIESYGIKFEIKAEVRKSLYEFCFLEKDGNNVDVLNYVTPPSSIFGAVKVKQFLQNLSMYDGHYIFVDGEALKAYEVLRNVREIVRTTKRGLLICEISDETTDLPCEISCLLGLDAQYKILVVSKCPFFSKHCVLDENNNFDNLTESAQENVLKKIIRFMGKDFTLSSVVGIEYAKRQITGSELKLLANNNFPELAKNPKTTLKYDLTLKRNVARNIHIISKLNLQYYPGNQNFFVINLDCDQVENMFGSSLKNIYGNNGPSSFRITNCHSICFVEALGVFYWVSSNGKIADIRNIFSSGSTPCQFPDSVNEYLVHRRLVILSGEPGSGKSTIVNQTINLLLNSDEPHWTIRVNLSAHSKYLKQHIFKSPKDVVEFLCKVAEVGKSNFEVLLLEKYLTDGRLTLFLDGFDEIYPDYETPVLDIIKLLRETNVSRLWVTTRTFLLTKLENELNTLGYQIVALTREEQIDLVGYYLNKFTDSMFTEEHKSISEGIVKKVSANKAIYGLLDLPLHAMMLTKYFSKGTLEEKQDKFARPINLANVYKTFVRYLLKRYYSEKKGDDLSNPINKDEYNEKLDLKQHKLIAIDSMFHTVKLFQELVLKFKQRKLQKIKKGIHTKGDREGLVVGLVDNRAEFVHRTFAEYLCAMWFTEKLDTDVGNTEKVAELAREVLFLPQHEHIRKLFDLDLISRNTEMFQLHQTIIDGNVEESLVLLETDTFVNVLDPCGRSPLEIACLYKLPSIVAKLISFDSCNRQWVDKLDFQSGCYAFIGEAHPVWPTFFHEPVDLIKLKMHIKSVMFSWQVERPGPWEMGVLNIWYLLQVDLDEFLSYTDPVLNRTYQNMVVNSGDYVKANRAMQHSSTNFGIADINGNTPMHTYIIKYGSQTGCTLSWLPSPAQGFSHLQNNDGDTILHLVIRNCVQDIEKYLGVIIGENFWDLLYIRNKKGETPMQMINNMPKVLNSIAESGCYFEQLCFHLGGIWLGCCNREVLEKLVLSIRKLEQLKYLFDSGLVSPETRFSGDNNVLQLLLIEKPFHEDYFVVDCNVMKYLIEEKNIDIAHKNDGDKTCSDLAASGVLESLEGLRSKLVQLSSRLSRFGSLLKGGPSLTTSCS